LQESSCELQRQGLDCGPAVVVCDRFSDFGCMSRAIEGGCDRFDLQADQMSFACKRKTPARLG